MRPGPHSAELSWITARPIAHRGLHNKAEGILENTAPAFAAAIAHNYPIECDLQLSADGEAMVFHDETLNRVTHADGAVIDRTTAELQAVQYRIGNARMQTLAELLEQVNSQVPLIIELKSHWNGNNRVAARAVQILKTYKGRFALMSFDPDLVAAVRELDPAMIRGITADRMVDDEWKMLPFAKRMEMRHFTHLDRTAPHFVSYDWHGLPADPVRHFRQNGLPVICWTVRNVETGRRSHFHADQITFEGYLA
ncbi:MAG: glycerophosphodiester phosphodiesterase [Aestuariivirgaceae bacterium]|nr:glycerophosphodiester phosphodiesterase [Aestuariivirgaceae bacterium]